jgi:hypothetical protein
MLKQNQPSKTKKKNNKPKPKKQAKPQQKLLVVQNTPAPVSKGVRGSIPDAKFSATRGGKICVRHSELLGTVSSSSDAFAVTAFPINPGLSNFTGWLSNVAKNYESYRFKKLRFRYIAACPTTVSGQVYVTVDFDASDPVPLTEQQISYYEGTRYSSPWNHQEYVCTASNLSKRKSYYVRSKPLGANQDVVLYDTGNLFVATTGTGSNSLGKLWVEYEVEFETPEFTLTPEGSSLSIRYAGDDNFVDVPSAVGFVPLTPSVAGNVLTLTSTAPYSATVGVSITGTGLSVVATGAAGGSTSLIRNQTVNSGATNISATLAMLFTAPGQTITFSITTPTSVTAYAMRLGQYNAANG